MYLPLYLQPSHKIFALADALDYYLHTNSCPFNSIKLDCQSLNATESSHHHCRVSFIIANHNIQTHQDLKGATEGTKADADEARTSTEAMERSFMVDISCVV